MTPATHRIPAAQLRPGDRIRSNSRVVANQGGVYVVAATSIRAFDGAVLVRCKTTSELGVEITATLVFGKHEEAEAAE